MTTHTPPQDDLSRLFDVQDTSVPPPAPVAKPRRGMRVTAIAALAALILAGGYVAWAAAAPGPGAEYVAREITVDTPDAVEIALPAQGSAALSVSGAEDFVGAGADGIWQQSGSTSALPIASLTKLITALVILDEYPLTDAEDVGPTITFTSADNDLYDDYYTLGATISPMPAGSSMSLRDALTTMLLPSASNYAAVLARWAFGSQGSFAQAAATWTQANGLNDTTIVEPSGIDPANVSTTADLIAIGKLAAAHPVIADIVDDSIAAVGEIGEVVNTNGLLGESGITGLKTGNIGPGTFAMLFTAKVGMATGSPWDVTGVVLGARNRDQLYSDVIGMINSLRAGMVSVPLADSGDIVGSFESAWGAQADVVVGYRPVLPTWSDTPIEVSTEITPPELLEDGAVVGTVTWTSGPTAREADLQLRGTIDPPSLWWKLTHPAELG